MNFQSFKYYLLAFFVTLIWGVTFVSTKILINLGLSPAEIFFYRFILAYLAIFFFCYKPLLAHSLKDELLLLVLGICGGSFFFLAENTALHYTSTSNVALLICTTQLFTTLLAYWTKSIAKLPPNLFTGTAVALLGIALVVFNGTQQTMSFNILGDGLALFSALLWAVYQLVIKRLSNQYSSLFVTRKVFFYGVITMIPYFLCFPNDFNPGFLASPVVIGHILFLGLLASMLCFWLWTIVVKQIGAVTSAYYIYLNPIVAMVASYLILDEPITFFSILGTFLIIGGVFYSEYKPHNAKRLSA